MFLERHCSQGFSDIAPWQGTASKTLVGRKLEYAGGFSDIAPWQGTARPSSKTSVMNVMGFSDIAPWQGTARSSPARR